MSATLDDRDENDYVTLTFRLGIPVEHSSWPLPTNYNLDQDYQLRMHQCLRIQEIVENICNQGFHGLGGEGRRGVLAFARTCRFLYEPAANVIWYRIRSLQPLVDCIPEAVSNSYEDDDDTAFCALQSHHLHRIQKLTARVRAFGYCSEKFNETFNSSDPYPDENVKRLNYEVFALANGFRTFLPNVGEVSIVNPDSAMFSHVNLFTNPDIKILRLMWSNTDEENAEERRVRLHLVSFLSSMRSRYPSLQELDIRLEGPPLDVNFQITVQDTLRSFSWERLSSFYLDGDVHTNLLPDLASCASLRTFNFRTPNADAQLTPFNHSLAGPLLLELEDLTLLVPQLSVIVKFLRLLSPRSQNIHSMNLWSFNPEFSSTQDWEAMISAVYERCDPLTLHSLNLDDGCRPSEIGERLGSGHRYNISLRDSPLFEFRLLTDVRIETFGVIDLDDQLIKTIVTSWPNIQDLILFGQHPLNLPPKVTFEGLSLFADNSPHLCSLSIEFVGDTPNPSKAGIRPRFGGNLEELLVKRSPLGKPGPVAALLADLFPNTDIILENDVSVPGWKHVRELHPVFVQTRRDEKDRREGSPTAQ